MKLPFDAPRAVGREYISLGPELAAAILLTLKAGWEHAAVSSDARAAAGELATTERLREGMRVVLNSKQFAWSKAMVVLPGTESRSRLAKLLPDGRTDIPIFLVAVFLQYSEHDPHAIVECKRISGTDTALCRAYVVDGIDRFKSGKYGENHALGFMAGYLVAGDATGAVVGINSYLTGRGRSAELLGSSDVIEEACFWRSRHPRGPSREAICLHHIFCAFM